MQQNSLLNFNLGYHPKPTLVPVGATTFTPAIDTLSSLNPGFFNETGQIFKIKVNGVDYDTTTFKCFDIYYTLGGDHPNPSNWTRYFEPLNSLITIAKTDVIRVIAVSSTVQTCPQGVLPSFVETNTYFVDVPHQTFDERFGVMSISLDQADKFWFASQGVPASTTVHVEYYDKKKQVSEGYAIINRPPHESWANKQKGFYISLDDRYGFGCSFEGPIFNCKQLGVSTRTNFPTVHLKSGDFEAIHHWMLYQPNLVEGTAMRDVLMQSLVALNDIKISALHIKPVITFVNGKYWGVYNLTEVFDKFYENFYNGQPLDQLDMNYYYNGDATVSYPDGSISSFKNDFKSTVYNVAIGGPLTQASRYNQLMASLDKESFMDYMILNNYAMNTDLFNFNMAFAKGGNAAKPGSKWHYYLWNTPSVFNFTAVATNTLIYGTHVISPCYLNTLGGYLVSSGAHNGHGKILTALFNANTGNPNFKLEYRTRYVDLINGPLRCENILRQFDTIRALYEKEMLCHMDAGCAAKVSLILSNRHQVGHTHD